MLLKIKHTKNRVVLPLCAHLLLAGCGINSAHFELYDMPIQHQRFLSQPTTAVELIYDTKRPYAELGHISASGRWYDDYDRVNELLREQARAIGADAIIRVEYDSRRSIGLSAIFISAGYYVANGRGIAVKFLDH